MDKFTKSAIKVLQENDNKPMKVKEITEIAIDKWYLESDWKTPQESMSSRIYIDIKNNWKKSYFNKVNKGVFNLTSYWLDINLENTWENKKDNSAKEAENKYKPYSEEELELIFSLPPTKENAKKLAKLLWRTEHGIEQQYQWAMLSDAQIDEKNKLHKTKWNKNMKCRKVAKRMWWIQTF